MSSAEWKRENSKRVTQYRKRYLASTNGVDRNSGEPWTESDMKAVLAKDMPDRKLAVKLGRSISAIQLKRFKLKRSI